MRKFNIALIALLSLIAVSACSRHSNKSGVEESPISSVAETYFSVTPSINYVLVGETVSLNADIMPPDEIENIDVSDVVWESLNVNIATVDSGGLVLGIASGSAIIMVTASADRIVTGSALVIVSGSPDVAVTSVSIDEGDSLELETNESYDLSVTVFPENATTPRVSWSISNNGTGSTIDASTGEVTAGSTAGTETVTVISDADDSKTDTLTLTVSDPIVDVTSVSIDEGDSLELETNESYDLSVTVSPENATTPSVTWSISNNGTGTVIDAESGAITAGTVTGNEVVTVISVANSSITATISIRVKAPIVEVTSLTINEGSSIELETEELRSLSVTVEPEEATTPDVTWSITDNGTWTTIGEESGELIAGSVAGKEVVTVTSVANSSITATISITIKDPIVDVTSVSIDEGDSLELETNESYDLSVTVSPENATTPSVTWSISNNGTGSTIDASTGEVTAGSTAGTETVTVISDADDSKTDTLTLTVSDPIVDVTSVSIDDGNISITINSTYDLSVTVSPENATTPSVTWSISNNGTGSTIDASTGEVTAGSTAGTETVTVISDADDSKTDSITLSITDPELDMLQALEDENFATAVSKAHYILTYDATNSTANFVVSFDQLISGESEASYNALFSEWRAYKEVEDGGYTLERTLHSDTTFNSGAGSKYSGFYLNGDSIFYMGGYVSGETGNGWYDFDMTDLSHSRDGYEYGQFGVYTQDDSYGYSVSSATGIALLDLSTKRTDQGSKLLTGKYQFSTDISVNDYYLAVARADKAALRIIEKSNFIQEGVPTTNSAAYSLSGVEILNDGDGDTIFDFNGMKILLSQDELTSRNNVVYVFGFSESSSVASNGEGLVAFSIDNTELEQSTPDITAVIDEEIYVEVSAPDNGQTTDTTTLTNLKIVGDYLYVSTTFGRLFIFDISTEKTPVLLTTLSFESNTISFDVDETTNTLVVNAPTTINGNDYAVVLYKYDVSTPANVGSPTKVIPVDEPGVVNDKDAMIIVDSKIYLRAKSDILVFDL